MNNLTVTIKSPDKDIFKGEAESISSENSSGKFDVLKDHANFITVIENKPIIIRMANKEKQTFTFPLAIMSTTNNQVNIYTNIDIQLVK
ncbi:hypothetical protein A2872_02040 [Candidatus Gottesmanbacteria bacterium RIFCSPHIGHO2_01_FULL_42_12]|uniref:ATP synthase F1 complex delta/epsilon subunit N-terminal domain-containing protein n=1 Tax=Candidatus Gottesmanbacteria bacterium RIFCSPHIGHO2_01_FULL_42_12 TaxID=1798377 RepID=A0A1F5Z6F3_9BACT|nr:MAG: hypothetical protein A2872_02040 [Candidatus Gottesmanbacteria bacterium RIFCSPHIGHO2_01_FULL_42_12]